MYTARTEARWFFLFIAAIFLFSGCNKKSVSDSPNKKPSQAAVKNERIGKVVFFIENSGSMVGYVKNISQYNEAIVSLAHLPVFDSSQTEFYFINGTNNPRKSSKLSISRIGTDPKELKYYLNESSFNANGDPNNSDLTATFEKALSSARGNQISVVISDCIYDVGQEKEPLKALNIESQATQKVFRNRLASENIETIIIKAISDFDGVYSFASKKGGVKIKQKRPFYIMIFGDATLLNKYLSENMLSERLSGYTAMARFMKNRSNNVPFQVVSFNSKGSFKTDRHKKNRIINAKKDRNGKGFQFTVAVDYSSLPFPDSYFKTKDNYTISGGSYKIEDIIKPPKKIHEITTFTPTDLITLHTNSSPSGNIKIQLNNIVPSWIAASNKPVENNIIGDQDRTFGFKNLIDAITEAYEYKNKDNTTIASFGITVTSRGGKSNLVIYLVVLIAIAVFTYIYYSKRNDQES